MYDEHFGLTGRPFQLTPDPAFWYETATHRRAMAYLGYGLAQGEGFIVITGDIGAGKTTLVGHLLDTLDREALNPVQLVSTAIEAADLLRIVAGQLGVDPAHLEKAQLLVAIERGLHAVARTGRRTLLIVDEAQALPTSALEELRMLSNFQAGGHALLQIVLLGQPEFRAALHGHERLEQLRQRVIAIHHLEPMAAGEVAAYVRHRLSVVGWLDRPRFADSAFAALHRYSDGVPRRLNQLANRVMLHAAVEELDLVTAATFDTVAADLFADLPTMGKPAVAAVEPVSPLHAGLVPASTGGDEQQAERPVQPWTPAQGRGDDAEEVEEEPVVSQAPVEPAVADLRHAGTDPASSSGDEQQAESPVQPWTPARGQGDDAHEAEAGEPVASQAPVEPAVADEPAEDEHSARPFRHSWLAMPEQPSAAAVEPEPPVAEAEPDPLPVAANDDTADRLAAIEARLDEQDEALRRVLTMMVEWVEGEQAARPAVEEPAPRGYVPIRGAAA